MAKANRCGARKCKHTALPWTVAMHFPRCLLHQVEARQELIRRQQARQGFAPNVIPLLGRRRKKK